jgi:hypothetical protein
MVKVKGYDYKLSTKKGKKLMVIVDNKTIHFGDSNYQQYKDKSGLLKASSNHMDEKRRANYLARARGQANSNSPSSATYHAINVLW